MIETTPQIINNKPRKFKTGSSRNSFKSSLEANIGYELLPLIHKALAPLTRSNGKTRNELLELKDNLLEAQSNWMVDDYRKIEEEKLPPANNSDTKSNSKVKNDISGLQKVHLIEALLPIDWNGLRDQKKFDYDTVARFVNVKFFPQVLIKFASDYLTGNLKITQTHFLDEYFHWLDKQLKYAVPKSKKTIREWGLLNINGKALSLYQSSASAFTAANAIHNMCGILNVRNKIRENCAFVEEAHRYVRIVTSQGVIPFFSSYEEQKIKFTDAKDERLHRVVLYGHDSPLRKVFG